MLVLPPATRLVLPSETLLATRSGSCVGAVTVIWIGVETLLFSLLSLTWLLACKRFSDPTVPMA